ncbi:AAWKG family protein [Streptomyces sp. NPDC001068]|uniref:AAWKG family protein n=1 Tax=Streptomyces sp. NPDC001068 TaxID=3364544 RepID=UPI0036A86D9C
MAAQSWEDILHLLTNWSLVKRTDVTDVTGDSGMPWINYKYRQGGTQFDGPEDYLAWIVPLNPNKGFYIDFYTAPTKDVRKSNVEITYLDNPAFHRYWGDSNGALSGLVNHYSSLKGDGASGDGAPSADGIQLKSFAELAWSFDAAGDFFKQQTEVLADWKQQLGSEQASWKGNAAGAFWLLVDDLHKKYENYTAQLQPPGFSPQHRSPSTGFVSKTLHGDDLVGAEQSLYKAYTDLYKIYSDFYWQQAKSITTTLPDGSSSQQQIPADPLDVLNQVLVEMGRWIIENNAQKIESHGRRARVKPGFSETTTWGRLVDASTWHAVAREATNRWTNNIETNLDTPARQVLDTLQKDWSRVLDSSWNPAYSFTDTGSSLTSDVQSESSDSSNDSLNDTLTKLGDGINNLGGGLNDLGDGINDGFDNLGDGINNVGDGLGDSLSNLTGDGAFSDIPTTGNGAFSNDLADSLGGGDGAATDIPSVTGDGAFTDLPDTSTLTGDGTATDTPSLTGGGAFTDLPDTSTLTGDGAFSNFNSGLPVSNIDGSTTTRTGSGVTTTYPDGNTVTRNADGSITSTFSDGTSRTVSPDGDVTTVDAQGHTTTSHLGVGESVSNPDGTSITRNGDGSLTQTAADGTKTTTFGNGASEIVTPNGDTQLTSPDGTVSHVNADGSLTTDNLDGSKVTVHPNGDVTTVDAQGHTTTSHLDTGKSITTGDGSTISVDGKGDIITHNPDGSSTTLRPDGTITTTQAPANYTGLTGNGNLTTPHIDIPTYSGGGQISYTPDGTTVTSHPNGVTQYTHTDGSGLVTTSDGQFQSIPSPQSAAAAAGGDTAGAAAGAGAGAGVGASALTGAANTDSQSAMGLLSPMMMMAGMNRMGGQQGGQNGGDRERNLYDGNDMDGAVIQHGMPPYGARANAEEPEEWEEEETDSDELLGPRRPSTESGYGPAGGPGQSTQSTVWSGKDKDVWGTEEGGLPASIGH